MGDNIDNGDNIDSGDNIDTNYKLRLFSHIFFHQNTEETWYKNIPRIKLPAEYPLDSAFQIFEQEEHQI
jgi:hypothetical protein